MDRGIADVQKAGCPTGPLAPGGSIDRLLARYPDLHADLSAGSGLNAFKRDLGYAREFVLKHRTKLIFGTDRFVKEEYPEMIDIFRGMSLPHEVEHAVFRGNADQLPGL